MKATGHVTWAERAPTRQDRPGHMMFTDSMRPRGGARICVLPGAHRCEDRPSFLLACHLAPAIRDCQIGLDLKSNRRTSASLAFRQMGRHGRFSVGLLLDGCPPTMQAARQAKPRQELL